MKISIIICFVLLATVIFAVLILARGFTAEVARQEAMIRAALTPEARDPEEIPELMRRFAERSLAGQGGMPRAVRLTQEARMLQGENWSTMTARQHIAIAEPGFVWVADGAGWPLPLVRVIDRFTDGAGLLEVRLLGAIRVARFDGPEADIGEAMRYLVELPWAPDAILSNRSIIWRAIDANTVEAALPLSPPRLLCSFVSMMRATLWRSSPRAARMYRVVKRSFGRGAVCSRNMARSAGAVCRAPGKSVMSMTESMRRIFGGASRLLRC
ncbi:hypothetical protein GTA62_10335 [Roseobacter sp. HKCCD9010]|nr:MULTISPECIES: DUF6544 family protein [unclassified Roseobacter]MBF9050893.1 hypothetical protein [Rhodobacterales bacterium HKCCD4356]NNV12662.1 hypothetical protein [Roseobacter sp. HKCCD7357]NNV16606.1 hypothetical protein [Roseobacter sp. HKCCD8768]NNV26762.1 hypothetical protein [Roseobacter sp. HKCCD8192]NNV30325.1 hypothetical protein [Roseobacter sp. HKCCD9061]